jgi:hypothetical protein
VTLCPAVSVPEPWDTLTLPIRLDGSEIDQVTGPPVAVIVIELPSRGVSSSRLGDTLIVPVAAVNDGGVVVGAEVVGDGEVGATGGVAGTVGGEAEAGAVGGAVVGCPESGGADDGPGPPPLPLGPVLAGLVPLGAGLVAPGAGGPTVPAELTADGMTVAGTSPSAGPPPLEMSEPPGPLAAKWMPPDPPGSTASVPVAAAAATAAIATATRAGAIPDSPDLTRGTSSGSGKPRTPNAPCLLAIAARRRTPAGSRSAAARRTDPLKWAATAPAVR